MSFPTRPSPFASFNSSSLDDPELSAPLLLSASSFPAHKLSHDQRRRDSAVPQLHDSTQLLLLMRVWIAAKVLQLGMETKFTALVLLHRYWNSVRSNQNDKATTATNTDTRRQENDIVEHEKWVAAACIFLACKAEEEPRRLRDVVNVAYMLQFGIDSTTNSVINNNNNNNDKVRAKQQQHQPQSEHQLARQKQPSPANCHDHHSMEETETHDDLIEITITDPPPLDDSYWQAKELLVATEQRVLRWLHFDVVVSHPHRLVLMVVNDLTTMTTMTTTLALLQDSSNEILLEEPPPPPCHGVIALSWQRLNDALFYGPALTHPAMHMACVAIALAATTALDTPRATAAEQEPPVSSHVSPPPPSPPSTAFSNTSFPIPSAAAPLPSPMPVDRDAHRLLSHSLHATEIALLNMLQQQKPTWWHRYGLSEQDFRATRDDMCHATETLRHMRTSK